MNEEIDVQGSVSEMEGNDEEILAEDLLTGEDDTTAPDSPNALLAPEAEGTDLDPLPDPPPAPTDPTERIGALEAELARVTSLLAERLAEEDRVHADYREFESLYPKTDLKELPDEVWHDVERGIPLAAAYALAERRSHVQRLQADAINQQNSRRSVGAVNGTENTYFSPAEVRAMSQAEVKKHYSKILKSMKKWNA